ncbi:MAG: hypothetical protein AAFN30_12325 [Actinomycetota bacterium]
MWPSDHRVRVLVVDTDDQRLTDLADDACARSMPGHSTIQFGLAALAHRDEALDDDERSRLGVEGHSELFGALVGWFCPERLPSIG